MKNILLRIGIVTSVIILIAINLFAQNCPNDIYSSTGAQPNCGNQTSSKPGSSYSAGVTVGQNNWDWTTGAGGYSGGLGYFSGTPGVGSSNMFFNVGSSMNDAQYTQTNPQGVISPFYDTHVVPFIADNGNSDFLWENGWELITKGMGYDYTEQTGHNCTNTQSAYKVPYFILYNRYTGVLRVLVLFPLLQVLLIAKSLYS